VTLPNESTPAEIVVSVLIHRAQKESMSERVYTERKPLSDLNQARWGMKEMLSIQLEKRVKPFCRECCQCSCHPTRCLKSPEMLMSILGKAFLRYCTIPQSTGACSLSSCRNRVQAFARFTYIFPLWIMPRLIAVTFMGDPFMVVRTMRLVPTYSDSLRLCSLNDVERLRHLFDKRIASPLDASAWDGRSLLHVRYSIYQ
jgi:hypothetical protein